MARAGISDGSPMFRRHEVCIEVCLNEIEMVFSRIHLREAKGLGSVRKYFTKGSVVTNRFREE